MTNIYSVSINLLFVFGVLPPALLLCHKNPLSTPPCFISAAIEKMSSPSSIDRSTLKYNCLRWCSIFQFGRRSKLDWPKVSTLMQDYGQIFSCRTHSVETQVPRLFLFLLSGQLCWPNKSCEWSWVQVSPKPRTICMNSLCHLLSAISLISTTVLY